MTDLLTRYRQVDYALPATYLSWDLFGAGLDSLGRERRPVELPLREPNADEILLRVDAIGLCFSDTKLIWAGNEHPRIRGRDLRLNPTVPGHEAALTVVKVGANWKNKFSLGQRFIIQADIFVNKEQQAFGYVQRGALAQYAYAGPMVLAGDDGCYLLPIQKKTGDVEAALVEPWACVEGSYRLPFRDSPKTGGRMLTLWLKSLPVKSAQAKKNAAAGPGAVLALGQPGQFPYALTKQIAATVSAEAVRQAVKDYTDNQGFDDIVIIGTPEAELLQVCDAALAKSGHLALLASEWPATALFDIGRIHYHLTRHGGSLIGDLDQAYSANLRQDILPGGNAWMVGAAGPMGQMHVQRALELPQPPKRVFATDISKERLQYMHNRLNWLAEKRGIKLEICDVSKPDGLEEKLQAFTENHGFDDIDVMAPVAKLVEQAMPYTADCSLVNIFAGVALGTMANLPPEIFTKKHVRVIGSSGSSMDDIKAVLQKMEAGVLATRMSMAALGGIEAAWEGIKGVKDGRFPGKTVIFPHLENLPLTDLRELGSISSQAASALENGDIWTTAAEQILYKEKLRI